MRASSAIAGKKRLSVPTPSTTPASGKRRWRAASSRVKVSGFSQNTAFPEAAALTISPAAANAASRARRRRCRGRLAPDRGCRELQPVPPGELTDPRRVATDRRGEAQPIADSCTDATSV